MPRSQRNVQQQVADLRAEVERIAAYATSDISPVPWLAQVLAQRGLVAGNGILVALRNVAEQDGEFYSGTWLSTPATFWAFEVTVARSGSGAVTIERFEDVTSQTNVSEHLPGKGLSLGAVALQVLARRSVDS